MQKTVTGFFVFAVCIAAFMGWPHDAISQTVAPGFTEAFRVLPDASLIGAWDIIAGFDLDNDGKKEFIWVEDPTISGATTTPDATWGVHYWENDGDNNYVERWSWRPTDVATGGRSYPAIALGDVDNDGLTELYFGSPADAASNPGIAVPRLYVFEHDGTNFPVDAQEIWSLDRPADFQYITSSLQIADVDNDGDQEIVMTSRNDNFGGVPGSGRTMLIANASGSVIGLGLADFEIEFADSSSVLKGGAVYDSYIVDFDGNGQLEVWVFTWDMVSWAIYGATGPNAYSLMNDVNRATEPFDEGERRGVKFIDMDKDGKLEMFVSTISGDGDPPTYVHTIPNTSNVASLTTADFKKLGGGYLNCNGSAFGDIDGDGLGDFLFSANDGAGTNKILRLEYKGSGSLTDSTSYDWSVLYEDLVGITDLRNIAITDMDGDNKTDILITTLDVTDATEGVVIILESDTPSAVKSSPAAPASFVLSQNYPNPLRQSFANGITTIEFELPKPSYVSITLFDVNGREVGKLVDQTMAAGAWRIPVDGRSLPAGVYFYQLKAGDFNATKKMILVR